MTRLPHRRFARRGFTLVELMVALALVVLILTILAVAFGAAGDTFSRMRSIGDMAERLRIANDKIKADLEGQHFETGDSPGTLRLSDLRYNLLTSGGNQAAPPQAGYFRIENGLTAATGMTYEGQDPDNLMSTRAVHHALEFTLKRNAQTPDDVFTVTSPTLTGYSATDTAVNPLAPPQFVGQWARVRWYLVGPTDNPGGVPTYTLYRSVRLLVPEAAATVGIPTSNEAEVFSTAPMIPGTGAIPAGPYTPHTLRTVTNPNTRAAAQIQPYTATNNPNHQGDDVVLTNVTSFEVKPVWEAGAGIRGPRVATANSLPATGIGNPVLDTGVATIPNSEHPFDELPAVANGPTPAPENPSYAGQRVFDTWAPLVNPPPPAAPTSSWNVPGSNESIPLRIRVTALQIKIRVFEPKNLLSRQVTLIVPQ